MLLDQADALEVASRRLTPIGFFGGEICGRPKDGESLSMARRYPSGSLLSRYR